MNIATSIYTNKELLEALYSESRKVFYEYTIANAAGKTLGKLPIEDGRVSFDSSNDVMRTFSGTTRKSNLLGLENTDFYLTPWMCLEYKNDIVRWPLGKFIVSPSESYSNRLKDVKIIGYDRGKVALDDKIDARLYVAAGSIYTSEAAQLAASIYSQVEVVASEKTGLIPMEWEIGTEKLRIINDLLSAISYNPFYFNGYGIGQMNQYIDPYNRPIDRIYQANKTSIIIDGLQIETNKFEIPNKFVRYVENPDSAYLISSYTNTDPNSPYSTVNRGRTIVDSDSIDNISSQADLDSYVRKIAAETMQATETLIFSTLNMPGHEYRDCLTVSVEEYGIEGKYIETAWEMDLSRGGIMSHKCQKVVSL